jgi:nitrogen regulatory protein PII
VFCVHRFTEGIGCTVRVNVAPVVAEPSTPMLMVEFCPRVYRIALDTVALADLQLESVEQVSAVGNFKFDDTKIYAAPVEEVREIRTEES